MTYCEDGARACTTSIIDNANILHWEERFRRNRQRERLTVISKFLTKRILSPIHSHLDRWLQPIIILREITWRVSISPVNGIIEKITTLQIGYIAVDNGACDIASQGVVSGFRIETSLRLRLWARSGQLCIERNGAVSQNNGFKGEDLRSGAGNSPRKYSHHRYLSMI